MLQRSFGICLIQKLFIAVLAGILNSGDAGPCPRPNRRLKSQGNGERQEVIIENNASADLLLVWVDSEGSEKHIGKLEDEEIRTEHTYSGHVFRVYSAVDSSILVKEVTMHPDLRKINVEPCGQLPQKKSESKGRDAEFQALVHDQFTPCLPEGRSDRWSCIRRTSKEDLKKRNSSLWGFKDQKEAQGRSVGATEDMGYTRHIPQMPRVTNGPGYLKMNMTKTLRDLLLTFYESRRKDSVGDEGVIGGGYTNNHVIMTKHLNLDKFPRVRSQVIREMMQVLTWWTQQDLKDSGTFGIRIYQREAMLINHVDRADSHIASAVLQVHQDVDEDGGWPLEVINGQGDCSEVFLQPGEMVLYEGGRFKHGRPMRLRGNSFANIFAHFAPLTWYGPGKSPHFVPRVADVESKHRSTEL